jgi:hypothetical protein
LCTDKNGVVDVGRVSEVPTIENPNGNMKKPVTAL